MGNLDQQIILMIAGAVVAAGLIGWLLGSLSGRWKLGKTDSDWRARYDKALQQIEKLKTQTRALETSLETERNTALQFKQAAVKGKTELDSLREKANTLAKNVFTLGAQRDQLSAKLEASAKLVHAAKTQIQELQGEFRKSKDFYTAQLKSAVERRQILEGKINDARHEQESLNNLLEAARSEHESVNRLLASAQVRLEGLEKLESKVVALEADNAELRHRATLATREAESLQHDVAELTELKKQNKELAHCLQSMENSRKQYEVDAKRYRNQYEQAEKQSETLRMKLGNIEESFIAMREVEEEVRSVGEGSDAKTPPFGLTEPEGEPDDLTEIVGIGKVFEQMLHELGVFHFRQIAAFGPGDVARINSELKETGSARPGNCISRNTASCRKTTQKRAPCTSRAMVPVALCRPRGDTSAHHDARNPDRTHGAVALHIGSARRVCRIAGRDRPVRATSDRTDPDRERNGNVTAIGGPVAVHRRPRGRDARRCG
jgi:predicted flap endonuclease-1-like 5' DNA nuclease/outer membrane murein-binding lipoprotein Lpp